MIFQIGGARSWAQEYEPRFWGNPDRELVDCLVKGHAAFDKEDYSAAVGAFQRCVEKHPKSELAHYWLGMAYHFAGQTDKGIAELKESAKLAPWDYHPLAAMGRIYSLDKRKVSLAAELLKQALALNSDAVEARSDLARIYFLKGKAKDAGRQFAMIFYKEKEMAEHRVEFGNLLAAMELYDLAKKQYQRALVLNPNDEKAKEGLRFIETKRSGK